MYSLLLGVRYGSAGDTITLLAIMVGGGKLKVEYSLGLSIAAAILARKVVIGAGIIYPIIEAGDI